jgi:Zn-dependent peptidase ImmA (M78 family)
MNAVFFRSLSAATKLDRGRGNSRIQWLSELIVPYLRQFVSLPEVNIPVAISGNPLKLSDDDIEEIANKVRRGWGLGDGPISNMTLLLENNGFILTRINLAAPALDAFTTISDGTPYIVLGADKQSAVRSRFDAAHECGHVILHRNIKAEDLKSQSDFKIIEQQANRFASALLVPQTTFADDFTIPTLNAFHALKNKWLVSIAMLIHRTFDLGFIQDEHYRKLWVNYNRRGWRKSEPLDDSLPIEQPLLLSRACRLIIEEKVRTPEQMLSEIPLRPKDIEEALGIPYGYLKPSIPTVGLKESSISANDSISAVDEVERIIKGL